MSTNSKKNLKYISLITTTHWVKVLVYTIVAINLMGCCSLRNTQCESFESLNAGDEFVIGETVNTPNLSFLVDPVQNVSTSGSAKVVSQNQTYGSGLSLRPSYVSLNFQHEFPVNEIKLKFADTGGSTYFTVNGEFRAMGDIVDLNGVSLGGVPITINTDQSEYNRIGDIILNGNITSFSIGGQEFWIDDYCFTTEGIPIYSGTWSVSLHSGVAMPRGDFDNTYDPGVNFLLDVSYWFNQNWALVGFAGYNDFISTITGVGDNSVWNLSLNLRNYREIPTMPGNVWSYYLGGGPGVYIPEFGDTELGYNIGFGLNRVISSTITAEIGMDYHKTFDTIEFIHTHIGVVLRL